MQQNHSNPLQQLHQFQQQQSTTPNSSTSPPPTIASNFIPILAPNAVASLTSPSSSHPTTALPAYLQNFNPNLAQLKPCPFPSCSNKILPPFEYCTKHAYLDANAPYKQCDFVQKQTNRRCENSVEITGYQLEEFQGLYLCNSHRQMFKVSSGDQKQVLMQLKQQILATQKASNSQENTTANTTSTANTTTNSEDKKERKRRKRKNEVSDEATATTTEGTSKETSTENTEKKKGGRKKKQKTESSSSSTQPTSSTAATSSKNSTEEPDNTNVIDETEDVEMSSTSKPIPTASYTNDPDTESDEELKKYSIQKRVKKTASRRDKKIDLPDTSKISSSEKNISVSEQFFKFLIETEAADKQDPLLLDSNSKSSSINEKEMPMQEFLQHRKKKIEQLLSLYHQEYDHLKHELQTKYVAFLEERNRVANKLLLNSARHTTELYNIDPNMNYTDEQSNNVEKWNQVVEIQLETPVDKSSREALKKQLIHLLKTSQVDPLQRNDIVEEDVQSKTIKVDPVSGKQLCVYKCCMSKRMLCSEYCFEHILKDTQQQLYVAHSQQKDKPVVRNAEGFLSFLPHSFHTHLQPSQGYSSLSQQLQQVPLQQQQPLPKQTSSVTQQEVPTTTSKPTTPGRRGPGRPKSNPSLLNIDLAPMQDIQPSPPPPPLLLDYNIPMREVIVEDKRSSSFTGTGRKFKNSSSSTTSASGSSSNGTNSSSGSGGYQSLKDLSQQIGQLHQIVQEEKKMEETKSVE